MAEYLINESGDIVAIADGDDRRPFDPATFGWLNRNGINNGEFRRSLDALRAMPGFDVDISDSVALVPGPRPERSHRWLHWPDGHAPPVALMSRGGVEAPHGGRDSTSAYFDRLTEAIGQVTRYFPSSPERSPMVIYDFVSGRRIAIRFTPPSVAPGGPGIVYLLDDGFGVKIGWTSGTVAQRVSGLQTGNPRTIIEMAQILGAGPEVEAHLQGEVGQWHLSGEWYQRGHIVAEAAGAGGIAQWLRSKLPPDSKWEIVVHPPYA